MSRSQTWLRHVLLTTATVGSLGFGATQALAGSTGPAVKSCPATGADYEYASCSVGCPNYQGYCSASGLCRCGQIP